MPDSEKNLSSQKKEDNHNTRNEQQKDNSFFNKKIPDLKSFEGYQNNQDSNKKNSQHNHKENDEPNLQPRKKQTKQPNNKINHNNPQNTKIPKKTNPLSTNPAISAGKNNVGKKALEANNNISSPNQSALAQEKEKNSTKLKEQLQKNTLRAINNVFMPLINRKTEEEKEEEEEEKKDNKPKLNKKGKSPNIYKMIGKIPKKKALIIGTAILVSFSLIIFIASFVNSMEDRFADLRAVGSAGVPGDVDKVAGNNQALKDMYNRMIAVQNEYAQNGKVFSVDLLAAVYHVLSFRNKDIRPHTMTEALIREIADYMFKEDCIETTDSNGNIIRRCTYTYSEEVFRNNLTTQFFPKYVGNGSSSKATEEVFEYLKEYKDLYGNTNPINMSSNGVCSYEIPGFVIGGSVRPVNLSVSNLHVRLMQTAMFGGVDGQPIPDEELVEFEKYILGVSWGEFSSGNSEAEKAQLIAARSYALARPTVMGTTGGRGLIQENGQWILSLCNSVADQVYCDPDQGCSRDVSSGQNSQVYSGATKKITYKPALASDAILRVYASEVNGVVLTDNNDNVIYTPYNSTLQNDFKAKGDQGWDYVSILLSHYASLGATKVKQMSCSAGTSGGGYASWKQNDPRWGSITLGNSGKSIAQIGCLATSVAMQIASSGVTTSVQDFNPGTFVEAMNKLGGFAGGLLQWGVVSSIAGGFNYQGQIVLSGKNKAEKLNTISNMLNQGYYLVAEVKGTTGEHWVAISGVNGNNITMMDPGSQATNMWSQYDWNNTSRIGYFKVS